VRYSFREVRFTYAEGKRSRRPWTLNSLPQAGQRSGISTPEAERPNTRKNAQRSQTAYAGGSITRPISVSGAG